MKRATRKGRERAARRRRLRNREAWNDSLAWIDWSTAVLVEPTPEIRQAVLVAMTWTQHNSTMRSAR